MLASRLSLANNALRIILKLLFKKIWKAKQNTQTSVISCSKIFCFTLIFLKLHFRTIFYLTGWKYKLGTSTSAVVTSYLVPLS